MKRNSGNFIRSPLKQPTEHVWTRFGFESYTIIFTVIILKWSVVFLCGTQEIWDRC